MENIPPLHLQEVVFSSSDSRLNKQLMKWVTAGKLRKIGGRLYTSNFTDGADIIVRRNLFLILGKLYPGALLSHRSALEFAPTSAGQLFITYSYTKKIVLPGITLRFMQGPGPIAGDNLLSGELYASQLERALLENLQVSRQAGAQSKTVTGTDLENRLEQIVRVKGEAGLNELRDKGKQIAGVLHMHVAFEKLNKLISALLQTHPATILTSPLAVARAFGHPYDPERILLFEKLFAALRHQPFPGLPESNRTDQSFKNFAFFEAYFSNYIEGTEFELEDAKRILDTGIPMPERNEDSHDILGTYQLVSNQQEMSITPGTADELLRILLYRHRILLSSRAAKKPGQFKDKNNRAGETYFVDQLLVKGTLMKGFDFYQALIHPFAKAAYMMFLVSEVHPFLDGNGRIARVMMNAELVKGGQSKIIIPTVYREDYMGALRRLTRQADPAAYVRMLQRACAFSAAIVGDDVAVMERVLQQSNAFKEPDKAKMIVPDQHNEGR